MAERYTPQCTICLNPVDLEKEKIIDMMSIVMTKKPDQVTHHRCDEDRKYRVMMDQARTTPIEP